VTKPDYAKWMLDDPRVNFAISTHSGSAAGVDHLGIQVEDGDELQEVYGRLREAEARCSRKPDYLLLRAIGEELDRRSAGRVVETF